MSEYATPEHEFHQAIDAVLSQSFQDFELLVVDDSIDSHLDRMLQRYDDPRIRPIHNNGNIGFAQSLNKALRLADAELVARLDTDDCALPCHLSLLTAFMTAHPEYAVVSTRAIEVHDDGHQTIIGSPGEKTSREVVRGDMIIHPASMLRRKQVLEVGGYPERFIRAEDLALWCELLLAGARLYVLDDVTCQYRVPDAAQAKRSFANRKGELAARMHYNTLLHAGLGAYLRIARTAAGGLLPWRIVQFLRLGEARMTGRLAESLTAGSTNPRTGLGD